MKRVVVKDTKWDAQTQLRQTACIRHFDSLIANDYASVGGGSYSELYWT